MILLLSNTFTFQDMEVNYFQTFIDGVDFVFIDSPNFRHLNQNIYGGNRVVMCMIILFLMFKVNFEIFSFCH